MELSKLQQEKATFEQRLRDVIQGEINKFMTEGGIHPQAISISMVRTDTFGQLEPTCVLGRVCVEFGL